MKLLNKILNHTYKPLLERYLQKDRKYTYKSVKLNIYKDVFHPGFFYSTKYVVNYLANINLTDKLFLEVGCGSGMISIFAAKQNAKVTAVDISPIAQKCASENANANNVKINVILSDMFDALPNKSFDYIMITPPYFKKNPVSFAEHAWYAGENLQYFDKLFTGLKKVANKNSQVFMVLADNCDIELIQSIGLKNNYTMKIVDKKKIMLEMNYIFEVKQC